MATISTDKVQEALRGAGFPATKSELISQARSNNADQEVVQALQGLEDRTFDSVTEVQEAFSKTQA